MLWFIAWKINLLNKKACISNTEEKKIESIGPGNFSQKIFCRRDTLAGVVVK